MIPFDPIGKRIAKAYLLFALTFALFFALVAITVVEGIELHLVDRRLEEVAAWASPRHAANIPVDMPAGLSFHHGAGIPPPLRGLAAGVEEITAGGVGLHVYSGRDAAGPFVVVDRASDYVRVELLVYSMIALSLLGFVGMSTLLGRYMARRFVTPIVALSTAVATRGAELPLLRNGDELGMLARAFDAHTGELRQFLERERAFTGDVSHELRTALTIISGAAELLLLDCQDKAGTRATSERIARAAREAAEIVDILLLLARSPELIESERLPIAPLLRDEVTRYQPLVANKPVRLTFDGGADFIISAPPRLVAAAVGNLIRNACLYTGEGNVSVRMENRSVMVRDSGPGLPSAVLDMLSSKADGKPLRGSEGTGLGLALVKRICRQLGATLEVAPLEQRGTVFRIHFPPI